MKTYILHPDQTRDRIRANLFAEIEGLPAKRFKVQISEDRRQRSQRQNAYLWGVCYALLHESTGQEPDDWHEYFLGEYFGWETASAGGKEWQRPQRRSSKLSTREFTDYVEFIRARAAEYGIQIPDPVAYL